MTTLNSGVDLLNVNDSPEHLARLYEEDYYWYLRSEPFRKAFFLPIADMVHRLGGPVLDVGCGEAVLADYVHVPYLGIDGSVEAVRRANQRLGGRRTVRVGRIEDPSSIPLLYYYATVLFGGVMEVLIKPEARVPLMEHYRERFLVRHFIIYDLERLDTSLIEAHYGPPVEEIHAVADMVGQDRPLVSVKTHRKILVYSTQRVS